MTMSKSKVTPKCQRWTFCNLYIVLAITSQVIVVSSWYLVSKLFNIICWCVAYKTHDYVKVTGLKVLYKCFDIWAWSTCWLAPGHLVQIFWLIDYVFHYSFKPIFNTNLYTWEKCGKLYFRPKTEFLTKKWTITLAKMGQPQRKSNLIVTIHTKAVCQVLMKFSEAWLKKMWKTEFTTKGHNSCKNGSTGTNVELDL